MGWRRARVGAAVVVGVLLAGLASGVPAQARAAVVNVACTEADLRTAIANSNAGTGDTLILASYCPYVLTDAGGGALPQIIQPLEIQGNNATIKRDTSASDFRIFDVGAVSLTMDTLTVMNGNAGSGNPGGGVFLGTSGGSLATTNVHFQGNTAQDGGAIEAESGTSISLSGGTISDNRATGFGGGLFTTGTVSVALDSVIVTRNRTENSGGGLFLSTDQPAVITGGAIRNNTAKAAGGGIFFVSGGSLTVDGTAITDNRVTASVEGGGGVLFLAADADASVALTDSTVSGNYVTGFVNDGLGNRGGGIRTLGSMTLDNTTVANNQLVGAFGQGAGIAAEDSEGAATTLTLQNGTTVTGNVASGRYSQGGGLYADTNINPTTVSVTDSGIDTNKVTGTGSAAAGVYNDGATFSFTNSSVDTNIAPSAPAPGGVYTTVAIAAVVGSTFTANFPTNCVFSPQPVTGCIG
ncbi:hypothetical protein [Streptomyces sp. NPDC127084]|uniref:hypothetical protein n=1 Tax=Streptomyces sp. NPDC127084 TaxID=3347133 RepID=UPI00364B127C